MSFRGLCAFAGASKPDEGANPMLMNVQKTVLPSGLRVVTSAMPHVQSVAFGIWVGVGSRHESDALSGISHFTEHLLFKGTKRRTPREISTAIEGRGGYL